MQSSCSHCETFAPVRNVLHRMKAVMLSAAPLHLVDKCLRLRQRNHIILQCQTARGKCISSHHGDHHYILLAVQDQGGKGQAANLLPASFYILQLTDTESTRHWTVPGEVATWQKEPPEEIVRFTVRI